MSNMWCYLRLNPPGPENSTAVGILRSKRVCPGGVRKGDHTPVGERSDFPWREGRSTPGILGQEIRDSKKGLIRGFPWRQGCATVSVRVVSSDEKQLWAFCDSDAYAIPDPCPTHINVLSHCNVFISEGLTENGWLRQCAGSGWTRINPGMTRVLVLAAPLISISWPNHCCSLHFIGKGKKVILVFSVLQGSGEDDIRKRCGSDQ